MTTFTLEPGVGALPVRFGMTAGDVARVLGPPRQVVQNYLGEREEKRDGVNVRYSEDGGVVELSLLPTESLLLGCTDLLNETEPIRLLLRIDPNPFEWVGSVIFLALGVSLTGYHDDDQSQRAITVFRPGRLDDYRDQFTPMERGAP